MAAAVSLTSEAQTPSAVPVELPAAAGASPPESLIKVREGTTHFRVKRIHGDGAKEPCWWRSRFDPNTFEGEWPIEICSLALVRERWGGGQYQLFWYHSDPGTGMRANGTSSRFMVSGPSLPNMSPEQAAMTDIDRIPLQLDPGPTPTATEAPTPAPAAPPVQASPPPPPPSPRAPHAVTPPLASDAFGVFNWLRETAREERAEARREADERIARAQRDHEFALERDRQFFSALSRGPAPDASALGQTIAEAIAAAQAPLAPALESLAERLEAIESARRERDDEAPAVMPDPRVEIVDAPAPPTDHYAGISRVVETLSALIGTVRDTAPMFASAYASVKGKGTPTPPATPTPGA